MPTRTAYPHGTFCWVDLDTPDPEGAARFYRAMFGWEVADERPDADYHLFALAGATAAGLDPLTAEDVAAGGRAGWNTYVAVDDAAAVAGRVATLGGEVVDEPHEVADAGCAACIADVHGATLWLWQASTFPGAAVVNEVGAWVWNDLQTPDVEASAAFYGELLGWEIRKTPGSGGAHCTISVGGRAVGGLMQAPPDAQPSWSVCFGVASLGAALEHAEAAGGRRVTDGIEVPGGRVAVAQDPYGATFSLFEGQYDD